MARHLVVYNIASVDEVDCFYFFLFDTMLFNVRYYRSCHIVKRVLSILFSIVILEDLIFLPQT